MDGSTIEWRSECVKTPVWISSAEYAWIRGTITSYDKDHIDIQVEGEQDTTSIPIDSNGRVVSDVKLLPRHLSSTAPVENMDDLRYLNEASVLENISRRFEEELIYTKTGPILIAMNPFKWMPNLYADEKIIWHHRRKGENCPPHCFAEVANAFAKMQATHKCQSVIICGESGAGKTEATKLMLQYLSKVNEASSNNSDIGENVETSSTVGEKLMQSNPLMEAFGNAKTIRNDNSSRFGKYILVQYKKVLNSNKKSFEIDHAKVLNFLLEKSRIVEHSKHERNFHIFYQVLASASKEGKYFLANKTQEDFNYLQPVCQEPTTGLFSSPMEDMRATRAAMKVMGMSTPECENVLRVVAAILHLGNVEMVGDEADGSRVSGAAERALGFAAKLLMVEATELQDTLSSRTLRDAGTEGLLKTPQSPEQATDTRDATCKSIYLRLFSWLVQRVNRGLQGRGGGDPGSAIGFLDIYGFENLETNGFEQLLINFANETLQSIFNAEIFSREQEVYRAEGVEWDPTEVPDNQACLDLIGKPVRSIFALVDEEGLRKGAGSDRSLVRKLHHALGASRHLSRPPLARGGEAWDFGVMHYAGEVRYSCGAFVSKNRDTVSAQVRSALARSGCPLVRSLFPDAAAADQRSALQRTIVAQFRSQLKDLVGIINQSEPRFVRCIKSNADQLPFVMDRPSCLVQLRNAGVMAALEMRRSGYPLRETFESFLREYKPLVPTHLLAGRLSGDASALKQAVVQVLNGVSELNPSWAKLGHTKVFLRSDAAHVLQTAVTKKTRRSRVLIQAFGRRTVARNNYLRVRRAVIHLQALVRGSATRKVWELKMREVKLNRAKRELQIGTKRLSDGVRVVLESVMGVSDRLSTVRSELRQQVEALQNDCDRLVTDTRSLGSTVQVREEELKMRQQKLQDKLRQIQDSCAAAQQQAEELEAKQNALKAVLAKAQSELNSKRQSLLESEGQFPKQQVAPKLALSLGTVAPPASQVTLAQQELGDQLRLLSEALVAGSQLEEKSQCLSAARVQQVQDGVNKLDQSHLRLLHAMDESRLFVQNMEKSLRTLQDKLHQLESQAVLDGTSSVKEVFDALKKADMDLHQFRIAVGAPSNPQEAVRQALSIAQAAIDRTDSLTQQAAIWYKEQVSKRALLQKKVRELEGELNSILFHQASGASLELETQVERLSQDLEVAKGIADTSGPLSGFEPLAMDLQGLGLHVPRSPRRQSKDGLLTGVALEDLVKKVESGIFQVKQEIELQEELKLQAKQVLQVARDKALPVCQQFREMVQDLRESREHAQAFASQQVHAELEKVQDLFQVLNELVPGLEAGVGGSTGAHAPHPVPCWTRQGLASVLPAVTEALQQIDGSRIRIRQHLQRHRLFRVEHDRLSKLLAAVAAQYGRMAGRAGRRAGATSGGSWWRPVRLRLREARAAVDSACQKLNPAANVKSHNTESLYDAQSQVKAAQDLVASCESEIQLALRADERASAAIRKANQTLRTANVEFEKLLNLRDIVKTELSHEESRKLDKEVSKVKNLVRELEQLTKRSKTPLPHSVVPFEDSDSDDEQMIWQGRNSRHFSYSMDSDFAPSLDGKCAKLNSALYTLQLALQSSQQNRLEQQRISERAEKALRRQQAQEQSDLMQLRRAESVQRKLLANELKTVRERINQLAVLDSMAQRQQQGDVEQKGGSSRRALMRMVGLVERLVGDPNSPLEETEETLLALKEQVAVAETNSKSKIEEGEKIAKEVKHQQVLKKELSRLSGKCQTIVDSVNSDWGAILDLDASISAEVEHLVQFRWSQVKRMVRKVQRSIQDTENLDQLSEDDLEVVATEVEEVLKDIDTQLVDTGRMIQLDKAKFDANAQIKDAIVRLRLADAQAEVVLGACRLPKKKGILHTHTRVHLESSVTCAKSRLEYFDTHLEHQVDHDEWVEQAQLFDASVQLLESRLEVAKREVGEVTKREVGEDTKREVDRQSVELWQNDTVEYSTDLQNGYLNNRQITPSPRSANQNLDTFDHFHHNTNDHSGKEVAKELLATQDRDALDSTKNNSRVTELPAHSRFIGQQTNALPLTPSASGGPPLANSGSGIPNLEKSAELNPTRKRVLKLSWKVPST